MTYQRRIEEGMKKVRYRYEVYFELDHNDYCGSAGMEALLGIIRSVVPEAKNLAGSWNASEEEQED